MDEKVIAILNDTEKYLSDLDKLKISAEEDLKGLEKYYAISMVLFSLLNRIIDLAQEVVILKKLGMPGSYRDIFRILNSRGIITKKMFDEMKRFVDLRNRLSHEYHRLDEKDILSAIKRTGVLKDFIAVMKSELEKASTNGKA